MIAHLHFFPTLKPNKKCKRATKPMRQDSIKMDRQQHEKKEGQHLTAAWRNGGCSASFDSFAVGSSAVLRINICAENPPLRQAANRYGKCFLNNRHNNNICQIQEIHLLQP